jgi:hypothetical protein
VSLGECLGAVLASLLDHKAVLTTEEQATLATIGANVEMRVRDLLDFHTAWTGGANPEALGSHRYAVGFSVMLHVCRRNVRNGLEQDGTRRDTAG